MPDKISFYPHSASDPEVNTPNPEDGDDFELSNEAADRLVLGVDTTEQRDVIGLEKIDEAVDKLKASGRLTSKDIKIIEIFKEIGDDFNQIAKILREEDGIEISSAEVRKKWRQIVREIKRSMPVEKILLPDDLVKRPETPFYEGIDAFLAEKYAENKGDFNILFKEVVLDRFKENIQRTLQSISAVALARYHFDPFSDVQETEKFIDSAIEEVRKDVFDKLPKLQQQNFLYFFKTGNKEKMGEIQKKLLERQAQSVVRKIQDTVQEWAMQRIISFL